MDAEPGTGGAGEAGTSGAEARWLLEPPPPGRIHLALSTGPDTDLSPAAREALETFLAEVQEEEVVTFDGCRKIDCKSMKDCLPMECGYLGGCWPLTRKQCLVDVQCNITIVF